MAQVINRGKELIRINTVNNTIEFSTNNGEKWYLRCPSYSAIGIFQDLENTDKEVVATTSTGIYYSDSDGRVWKKRGLPSRK